MVYAFLIHTLLPGRCYMLYSAIYVNEAQTAGKTDCESIREENKRCLFHVACRVQSEYSFRCAVEGTQTQSSELVVSTNEVFSLMKSGIFRLHAGSPFSSEKHVIWNGLNNCGFVMICEKNENRVAAQNILGLIVKFAQQHCGLLEKPHEVLVKPDRLEAVLHHFLPCGQLLPLNHRVVRQFEKDLNLTINNKT